LVELLIVIIIIGALMAVAVPSLLNSRDAAGNSSAKQQLTAASTEIQTSMLRSNTLPDPKRLFSDDCEPTCIVNQIAIVGGGENPDPKVHPKYKSALNVSAKIVGTTSTGVIIMSSTGANGQCWAVKLSLRLKQYGTFTNTDCSASLAETLVTAWDNFGFPPETA
jgi:type II secretory pathway pseudopilin PulG